jgi:hypothetical protein
MTGHEGLTGINRLDIKMIIRYHAAVCTELILLVFVLLNTHVAPASEAVSRGRRCVDEGNRTAPTEQKGGMSGVASSVAVKG